MKLMHIKILRGSNEIGGTCIKLSAGDSRILLDLGRPLDKKREIIPADDFITDALLISHPHQDHFGFIDAVDPRVPVYIGKLGRHLIDATRMLLGNPLYANRFQYFKNRHPFQIGDFIITPYLVDHSAVDAYAFLIEAYGMRVFYSGDFRAHGRKAVLFEEIVHNPPKDIDVLFMEGTMLERSNDDFPAEADVENKIFKTIKDQKNIAFLVSSSQNIDRIVSAYRACKRAGKILILDIYTAWVLEKLKLVSQHVPSIEWESIGVYADFSQDQKLKGNPDFFGDFRKRIYEHRIKKELIAENPARFLWLSKMSRTRTMNYYKKESPINVIYSQWLGYLKCTDHEYYGASAIAAYRNDPQVNFVYAHTSGHAAVDDLRIFAEALKPRYLVPIHTEQPDKYAQHFSNVTILEDEQAYTLTDQKDLHKEDNRLNRMADLMDKVDLKWIEDTLAANKELLEKMIIILDEVDPEGLVYGAMEALGRAVVEEYKPEAETILLRQSEWVTVNDLAKVVAEEFAWWFYEYDENGDPHYDFPRYKLAARKIWNARLEVKGQPPEEFADDIILPPRARPILIEVD